MNLAITSRNHNTDVNYMNPAWMASLILMSGGVGASGLSGIPPMAYNWSVPAVYSGTQVGVLSDNDELKLGEISADFILITIPTWLRQDGYGGSKLTDTLIAEPPIDRNITSVGSVYKYRDRSGFREDESVLSHAAVESAAKDVFGQMRSATTEENESVREYYDSISVDAGINFFDLL